MRKLATACLLAVAFAGCGYRARFDLPPHLRTFSVATFTNKTLERNVDFEFTQALIREIHAKTRLRVAPAGSADLLITGEVDELERDVLRRKTREASTTTVPGRGVVRRDARDLKSEVRHRLYINVAMLDRTKDVMFFEGKRITRRVEFRLNSGETARQAREEVIRELARRVVSLAFERWPARGKEANARAR